MLLVHLLLTRTKIGKAMRANGGFAGAGASHGHRDREGDPATWIVGACLATAAGVFLALDTHVETLMGFKILPLFASALLGGIGSAYGAMVGGLVIGIAEEPRPTHGSATPRCSSPATRRASRLQSW